MGRAANSIRNPTEDKGQQMDKGHHQLVGLSKPGTRNGPNGTTQYIARSTRKGAMAQVSELYARENEFDTALSTRLLQSTKALQTWYRNMKEKITNSILLQQERILRQQPLIRDWIQMNTAQITATAQSNTD